MMRVLRPSTNKVIEVTNNSIGQRYGHSLKEEITVHIHASSDLPTVYFVNYLFTKSFIS
jgi:hypothetical protein